MLKYNYHTHTKRCGHASGEDEEYVLRAIDDGYKVLGFSDHVMLPGMTQKGIRGDYSELEGYLASIRSLQEKYKDQITIHCGLECEYFEEFASFYKELLATKKVDYLILGQHFYFTENGEFASCTWYAEDVIKSETKYIELLIKGMASGIFKYVAHPDVYCLLEDHWTPEFESMAHQICKAAIQYDIPLEINLCQTRSGDVTRWRYPNEEFWKIASTYGVRVVIGADAHKPEMLDTVCFERAFELIERYNLKYEEKVDI
ncbi:MAG: histidinol-phosphatase [Bacilli bacterium]|nr:histidinol-phosphatase [Bacilli bacterium]